MFSLKSVSLASVLACISMLLINPLVKAEINPHGESRAYDSSKAINHKGVVQNMTIVPHKVTPKQPNIHSMTKIQRLMYDPNDYVTYWDFELESKPMVSQYLNVVAFDLYVNLQNSFLNNALIGQCTTTPGFVTAQFAGYFSTRESHNKFATFIKDKKICKINNSPILPSNPDIIQESFNKMRQLRAIDRSKLG
ncbi:MAG: hypothetical protein ACRCXZ_04105 [Patescibacteria group bacterium]